MHWWFKKLCKGDESLEDEEHSGWPSKVDNDQLRAIIEANSLTTTLEVTKELKVNHSPAFGIWSKLERCKSSVSVSWTDQKFFKNRHFKVLSSVLCNSKEPFLNRIVNSMKVDFVQWLTMTSSAIGPRRGYKALPKAKLALKKDHGNYLLVCCWSDPLQLSESWRNHYIWEVCSANQWDTPKTAKTAASIGQ